MSVIEVVVVLVIVTTGIAGAYQIISSGTRLADTTESRIQAIAYAKEGLEGIENIRDTNWIKFSSDYTGCFDVFGYDVTCVGSNPTVSSSVPRIGTGSYTITQTGGLWQLNHSVAGPSATIAGAGRTAYLNEYALYTNTDGLTSQSGGLTGIPLCTGTLTRNCKTRFARELRVTRPDVNTIVTESVVSWVDPSRSEPFEVVLSATLKNWKMKYFEETP
jgi:Tfp pilus assembly protein PilV